MKINIFSLILSFLLGFTCSLVILHFHFEQKNLTNNETEKRVQNLPYDIINEETDQTPKYILLKGILNDGNIDYYHQLQIRYIKGSFYEFLPIALIMANKHNSKEAYFDVFFALCNMEIVNNEEALSNYSLDSLDKETQSLAIHYLQKSAEFGNRKAKEILGGYYKYGRFVDKNEELGLKLLEGS